MACSMMKLDRRLTIPFKPLASRAVVALLCAAVLLSAGCVGAPDRVDGRQATDYLAEPLRPDTEELILLIHGSGDTPEDWPRETAGIIEDVGAVGLEQKRRVIAIDWSESAARRLAAPRRGARIGRTIAEYLLGDSADAKVSSRLSELFVVSHSAGAHVAYGLARRVRELRGESSPQRPEVTQFYLDPFLARSPVRLRYGLRHFGTAADRAFAMVNTADRVPFTDGFPRATCHINVTPARDGGADPDRGHCDRGHCDRGHCDRGHWLPIRVFNEGIRSGQEPAALLAR